MRFAEKLELHEQRRAGRVQIDTLQVNEQDIQLNEGKEVGRVQLGMLQAISPNNEQNRYKDARRELSARLKKPRTR